IPVSNEPRWSKGRMYRGLSNPRGIIASPLSVILAVPVRSRHCVLHQEPPAEPSISQRFYFGPIGILANGLPVGLPGIKRRLDLSSQTNSGCPGLECEQF